MERSVKKALPVVKPSKDNLVDYVSDLAAVVLEIRTVLNRLIGEYVSTDDDYTCLESDWIIHVTAAKTVTLPSSYRVARIVTITKSTGYAVTVVPQSGETINGAASNTIISGYSTKSFVANDGDWETAGVGVP
jgi:hypothetical protein